MKKRFNRYLFVLLAGLGALLAGCSGSKSAGSNTGIDANASSGEGRTPPLSMQLALGTIGLEGTENAVTPEQAKELLPLWKAAKSLGSTDNVTTQEMDGLYKQIQKAMTAEQVQAIQSMDLSGENMTDLMNKLGIEPPQNRFQELTPELQVTMEARRSSGERPEGFPPGGGPGGGMGPEFGGGPPQGFQSGDQNDEDQPNPPRAGFDTAFFDAVIKLLEGKVQ